jgi:hypothetical protein
MSEMELGALPRHKPAAARAWTPSCLVAGDRVTVLADIRTGMSVRYSLNLVLLRTAVLEVLSSTGETKNKK